MLHNQTANNTIFTLFKEIFKKDEMSCRKDIEAIRNGQRPGRSQPRKYQVQDNNIRSATNRLDSGSITLFEYLETTHNCFEPSEWSFGVSC